MGRRGLDALVDEFQAWRHLPRGSQGLDGQLLGPVVPHALHTCAGQSGAVRLLADSPVQVDLQDRQATFMSELDLGLGDTCCVAGWGGIKIWMTDTVWSRVESDLNDRYSVKSGVESDLNDRYSVKSGVESDLNDRYSVKSGVDLELGDRHAVLRSGEELDLDETWYVQVWVGNWHVTSVMPNSEAYWNFFEWTLIFCKQKSKNVEKQNKTSRRQAHAHTHTQSVTPCLDKYYCCRNRSEIKPALASIIPMVTHPVADNLGAITTAVMVQGGWLPCQHQTVAIHLLYAKVGGGLRGQVCDTISDGTGSHATH